jgi:hypothetical protein
VPQYQKSKGSLIMTAALELSLNQITHFYSPRKDTGEMLRMLTKLIQEYKYKSRIYLSWDAASWHMSKMLRDNVDRHNEAIIKGETAGPVVDLAPLPAGAQFLSPAPADPCTACEQGLDTASGEHADIFSDGNRANREGCRDRSERHPLQFR